jgi:hypothetical protein
MARIWAFAISDVRKIDSGIKTTISNEELSSSFFVKNLRYTVAQIELCSSTGEQAYSLWQMKRWIHRFKKGDLSWEDNHRSEKPLSELSGGIRGHLDKYPLISVKQLAKNFGTFVLTISRILTGHLGLRKFTRRWAPQNLTDDQKQLRREIPKGLLNALRNDESAVFSQVTIGNKSWFSCHYQSTYCYVKSRAAVPQEQKLALDVIHRETKFDHNYFLFNLIRESSRGNTNARCGAGNNLLLASIDSPMCHMHTKVRSIATERQRGEFLILFILRNYHRMASGSLHTQKSKWKIK